MCRKLHIIIQHTYIISDKRTKHHILNSMRKDVPLVYYQSCAPCLVTLTFKLPHALLQNFFRFLLLPISQVQSSQTPSLNVISLEWETNIARISFFSIQVTCPHMWFNYTNNAKYIQLLEYLLFLVIKNINKTDHPSLLNNSIRQNQFQNTV
jgi:hypothetical protein